MGMERANLRPLSLLFLSPIRGSGVLRVRGALFFSL